MNRDDAFWEEQVKLGKQKESQSITQLLHQITQAGYEVQFSSDFSGMVRISFTEEYGTLDNFYEHHHISYPDCPMEELEKKVLECLKQFNDSDKK